MKASSLTTACLVVWTAFAVSSSVSVQTGYYNHDLHRSYVRLSQQLRQEINTYTSALTDRVSQIISPGTILTKIEESSEEGARVTKKASEMYGDILARTDKQSCSALAVAAPEQYTDITQPVMTSVKLDHGIVYRSDEGSARIIRSGLYMLEAKIQSADYSYFVAAITVRALDGTLKYNMDDTTKLASPPLFRLLVLESGDTLESEPISHHRPTVIRGGIATQIHLRYVGSASTVDEDTGSLPVINLPSFPTFPINPGVILPDIIDIVIVD